MAVAGPASIGATTGAVRLADVATPFALIDGRRLRRNIAEMQSALEGIGAALRPHFKTHRTSEIAQLQLDAGAIGLTVATVPQLAKARAELACPVLISSLLQLGAATAPDLRAACAGGEVTFAVESEPSIEALRRALGPDLEPEVLIEVEAGCLRSGVPAAACPGLARAAARAGLRVVGVFSYPGQSYLPGQAAGAAKDELAALEAAERELRRAGVEVRHVSAGSTPTMPFARAASRPSFGPEPTCSAIASSCTSARWRASSCR